MIDKEKIKSKIRIIHENLQELEDMKSISLEDLLKQKRDVAAAKYFIRVSIEAMIDIGSHIIAKCMLGSPSTNAEVMKMLGEKGILPQENLPTYLKMVKYRNRLVHFYHEVTIPEIYDIIQNHQKDFKCFIKDILIFLDKHEQEKR
jgi:uncharacterized protein YutE (UPF0331/DUF86 family)